ncbi:MAG: DUF2207 domain-containing protein, partial [Acidimicrobiales bacterium]|nr:DUF2207 domain-containing protein [Acidimicrobiales bacterium]
METDPDLPLAVLGLFVGALTWMVAGLQTWFTRPRAPRGGQPTMDLLDEPPPAIVDLVTDDFEVTPESVPATLCDLAARRWLSIEEAGFANVVIRLGRGDGHGSLLPYEQQVLDHMHALAVGGVVPAKAMTTGPEAVSRSWWRRFERAVVADGQRRGLCRNRWSRLALAPVVLGAVATGAVLFAAQIFGETRPSSEDMSRDATIATGLLIVGALVVVSHFAWVGRTWRRGAQRETDRGLAVAGHWLGVRQWMDEIGHFADKPAASVTLWERYLGYAVALDLAHTATLQLPLGAEDDRHAWSRASGHWRQVRVSYPRWRPGWGTHPFWALVQALLVGGAAGAAIWYALQARSGELSVIEDLPEQAADIADIVALVIAALAVPIVLWCAVKLVRALPDLFTTRDIEGEAVRMRRRRTGHWLPDPVEKVMFSGGSASRDQRKERRYLA